MSRPEKHSLTIGGHRTSVSLEAPFWAALREIAGLRGLGINALVTEIDATRGPDTGLATAIRLFVLDHFRRLSASSSPARTAASQAPASDLRDA